MEFPVFAQTFLPFQAQPLYFEGKNKMQGD
jgi:hypothetical protein